MASLSEFFSHLHTLTIIFISLLLLEIVLLTRSVIEITLKSGKKSIISTTQYLRHVEEKSPAISYSKKSMGQQECALKCRHTFHKDCLDEWLQQCLATCPLCRAKVLPDEIVAKYDRVQSQIGYDGSDEEMIFMLSALYGNSLQRFS
ncbi:E3 ubiquitin-protein ligase [Salix suchowensis]|nr:E3 ubiquitin-protein ligase [Salix suchowensis]